MSDRIKKIKIKQQDGTMSDYYDIGVNAQNVDINYNGSDLETTLKKTPKYYDNVASMKLDDTLIEGDLAIVREDSNYYSKYKITDEQDSISLTQLNNGLYAINMSSNIPFNKYIESTFGLSFNPYTAEVPENGVRFADFTNNLIITIHMNWDSENEVFKIHNRYMDETTYLPKVKKAGEELCKRGVFIKAIKFHSTKFTTLTSYTPEFIIGKYKDTINRVLSLFDFDYESIILFNEDNIVEDANYVTEINSLINYLRTTYNKTISISKNGISMWDSVQTDIKENMDFFAFNFYGDHGINGEMTTLEEVANHFDQTATKCLKYKKLYNKPVIMTEFGCGASWYSFHNGEQWRDDGLAKPIALVIEGYFKSRLSTILDGAYYWYSNDAYKRAPLLLKDIKNQGGTRHV